MVLWIAKHGWVGMGADVLQTSDAGLPGGGVAPLVLRRANGRGDTSDEGIMSLISHGRRAKIRPNQEVLEGQEQRILEPRRQQKPGARLVQHEVRRLHGCHLSFETIRKVLEREDVPPLHKNRRKRR